MGEEENVKKRALQIIATFHNLPRLIVFDLDYTLWPFYCECYYEDEMPYLYPQARGILCALKEKGIDMAIASRSPTPKIAKTFLNKLGIQSLFVAQEIFSSRTHKTDHFQRIHRKTGIPYGSMLFFDDEDRNIEGVKSSSIISFVSVLRGNYIFIWNSRNLNILIILFYVQVSKMGVISILVGNGVNLEALRKGLSEFSQNLGSSSSS
ncbi:unnamed protein product [Lupinus luteus]|uniref:Magnesium-dependent phosphatase 1 n=1 Tax=Lupinus luteus TaxID=3873 RepID=A0AAV1WS05_LUPLU